MEIEKNDLKNRALIVIGGSSGIGLEAVIEGSQNGYGQVFAGTTALENFTKAKTLTEKRRKKDLSGVTPFVIDVADEGSVSHATNTLSGEVASSNQRLDVIYSQAAGMEGFSLELYQKYLEPIMVHTYSTPIEDLGAKEREEVDDLLMKMHSDLAVWTRNALPRATEVNYMGTMRVYEGLEDRFPGLKKRGAFINSTWGHLSGVPGIEIPFMYGPVDESKALVRDALAGGRYDIDEEVASLVKKTKVGKMFADVFFNLMDPDQRAAVKDSSINPEDVTGAIWKLFDDAPEHGSRVRYVYGKDGAAITADTLEISEMYTKPYRF